MRTLLVDLAYAPSMVNGIAMLGGGLLGFGMSSCLETTPYVTDVASFSLLLATIILISNCIGHTLYAYLVSYYSLTLIQIGYLLAPMLSKLSQVIFGQGTLSFSLCASSFMCSIGFIIYYWQECYQRKENTVSNTIVTSKNFYP